MYFICEVLETIVFNSVPLHYRLLKIVLWNENLEGRAYLNSSRKEIGTIKLKAGLCSSCLV